MTFSPIFYHHIGGRGGKFPIEIPSPLKNSVSLTLYDADKSCIEESYIKLSNQGYYNVEILPYCISDKHGVCDFIITKQPQNSSLLPSDPAFYNYLRNSPKFGAMRLGEMLSPHAIEKVETNLLSTIIQQENKSSPDFISLDIQGAEYDVISASKNLFKDVLLVNLEAMFTPMYKDQKNFPELHNLMTTLGFILVDLKLYDPHHLCRTPIDFDAKGFVTDGEAFYIKQPDFNNWAFEKILKYCFAAILCHQTHLCIKVFEIFDDKFSNELEKLESSLGYIMLIKELYTAYQKASKFYLPFFHDTQVYHSYHQQVPLKKIPSKNVQSQKAIRTQNRYKDVLKRYHLYSFVDEIQKNEEKNINTLNLLEGKMAP